MGRLLKPLQLEKLSVFNKGVPPPAPSAAKGKFNNFSAIPQNHKHISISKYIRNSKLFINALKRLLSMSMFHMTLNFRIAMKGSFTHITQMIFHLEVNSSNMSNQVRSLAEGLRAFHANQIL